MSDERNNDVLQGEVPRRDFVGLSVAAGVAAATATASAAGLKVVETDVEVKTPDGTCDAAFIHPASGSHPGVLLWPDAFGLRPSMREMAKRLGCAEGYSALVPNWFYLHFKSCPLVHRRLYLQLRGSRRHEETGPADGIRERPRQCRERRGRLRRFPRRAKACEQV